MRRDQLLPWADLVGHVPPRRIAQRALYTGRRRLAELAPRATAARWREGRLAMPPWPVTSATRSLASGSVSGTGLITAGGHGFAVGPDLRWSVEADAPRLARFELHGFEWLWRAEGARDARRAQLARLWPSWAEAHPYPKGDAWHPFVVSLRLWVLLDVFDELVRGGEAERAVTEHIELAAGHLRHTTETFLGGNHLLENLKTLAGVAFATGDAGRLSAAVAHFVDACADQHLPDGGHIERSPGYHAQVLADMLDVRGLAEARGIGGPELDELIDRSRSWLGGMRLADGCVPPFNDSPRLGPAVIGALGVDALASGPRLRRLDHSGFVTVAEGGWSLVAETGGPGPREHAGHAHAGTLGFELMVGDQPVLVDTGASEYSGSRRLYERSSSAHNVVRVDGEDTSSVWGDFRTARLASARTVHTEQGEGRAVVVATAELGGRLGGIRHRRSWTVTAEEVRIDDLVEGEGVHEVETSLHLAPGLTPVLTADGVDAGPVSIDVVASPSRLIRVVGPDAAHAVARGIGHLDDAAVVHVVGPQELPCRRTIVVRRRAP